MTFLGLLQISAPVFLVLGAGSALRISGLLRRDLDGPFLKLAIFVFYPCLIFDVMVGNDALLDPANILLPPVFGFGTVMMGYGVSWISAKIGRLDPGLPTRTFSFTCGIQNYGYIALPVCLILFGRDAAAVLFGFVLGVELAFWGVGILIVSGRVGKETIGHVLSPPVLAILFALVFNLLGGGNITPVWASQAIEMLGACSVPFGLLLTGALFADYAKPDVFLKEPKIMFLAIATRLGVLPVLILGLAIIFPLDVALRQVLLVQASMASALAPIAVCRLYGGDMQIAAKVILPTTILGVVTIPFWIWVGAAWLGEGIGL